MSIVTRTINPLHLEVLEPHRFEDLIRQLLYDFRQWRQLEATGRSGSDNGYDARGWEIVNNAEPITNEDGELEDNTSDRLWLIQCKREQSIGPSKLEKYLNEIPVDDRKSIYGIVFAASCDFSTKCRNLFREKSREFGFSEAHLWGKGEIEDMMFQPKNDHILFAFTGISLQIRQRSLKSTIRAKLSIKRKLQSNLKGTTHILIRDADDDRYPTLDADKNKDRRERGRWFVANFEDCKSDGLHVLYKTSLAYIGENGIDWDFAERMNDSRFDESSDPWMGKERVEELEAAYTEASDIWGKLSNDTKGWFTEYRVIPYENIIEIDKEGDEHFENPHLYTMPFDRINGPYRDTIWCQLKAHDDYKTVSTSPIEKNRVKMFPREAI